MQIGLDDFGTGYASLTHLRRLPLTFVKIDQSFVQGLGDRTRRTSASSPPSSTWPPTSACDRSPRASRRTEQLDRLRELGCDQAQGYLFARPLSPDAVCTAIEHPAW